MFRPALLSCLIAVLAAGCAANNAAPATTTEFDLNSVNVDSPSDIPAGRGVTSQNVTLPFSATATFNRSKNAYVYVAAVGHHTMTQLTVAQRGGASTRAVVEVYSQDPQTRRWNTTPDERRVIGARDVTLELALSGMQLGRTTRKFAIVVRNTGFARGTLSIAATRLTHTCADTQVAFEELCTDGDTACIDRIMPPDESAGVDACCESSSYDYCEPAPTCEPVLCRLFCPFGWAKDERGCDRCACADRPTCPPVVCALYCPWGFATGPDGCSTCTCAPPPACRPVLCELFCENGFATDETGCEVCRCR